jgi:hypothetical protein
VGIDDLKCIHLLYDVKRRSKIMKFLNFPKRSVIMVIAGLVFANSGLPDVSPESYSKLLKQAVSEAGRFRGGYELLSARGSRIGLPTFTPFVERFHERDAVPYLLKVIREGPDWENEKFVGRSALAPHIARCYAVLCLATSKDPGDPSDGGPGGGGSSGGGDAGDPGGGRVRSLS